MQLYNSKHEKFFNRCLVALPAQAASEDSNKLAIIYFSLHGLKLLQRFNFSIEELKYHENCIWETYFINKGHGGSGHYQTFRSTPYFKAVGGKYDYGDLSACFFALYILIILGSDFKRLDWQKLFNYVIKCQIKNGANKGGFVQSVNDIGFGETDVRQCYMALVIRHLASQRTALVDDIDLPSAREFILSRLSVNGGFSFQPLDEPHLGYTFCAIASLKLLGYNVQDLDRSKNWLIHRQVSYPEILHQGGLKSYEYHRAEDIGGFNGRENKLSDTCYSWWCNGSLSIMDPTLNLNLINQNLAEQYLLEKTQNPIVGGFSSVPDATSDPMHTYLALAALSLWNRDKYNLAEIEPVLVMPNDVYESFCK
ncbi:uncharacterized protein LODBEIA_P16620 [Lodderomyces beijingensis]|uniref:Prenyltransferase alpha-alpha toroid domain-containing protein n=1 Tax=Lodderomyces beijingensis TaxID=1775926 RepID=A0ABP0ZGZ2_9ASCO